MPDLHQLSDVELFIYLKDGDVEAYEAIFRRYHGVLLHHAGRILKDEELAHDVVQEVFEYLWRKRESIELHTALSSYLYKSVRNAVLNQLKRNQRYQNHLEELARFIDHKVTPADNLVRTKQLQEIIEREIDRLPLRMREVFMLRRQEDLSYKDIAKQLGISELTVKTQLNKAVKLLRKRLIQSIVVFFISVDTTYAIDKCLINEQQLVNQLEFLCNQSYFHDWVCSNGLHDSVPTWDAG